jgi:hypothetical protein
MCNSYLQTWWILHITCEVHSKWIFFPLINTSLNGWKKFSSKCMRELFIEHTQSIICTRNTPNMTHTLGQVWAKKFMPKSYTKPKRVSSLLPIQQKVWPIHKLLKLCMSNVCVSQKNGLFPGWVRPCSLLEPRRIGCGIHAIADDKIRFRFCLRERRVFFTRRVCDLCTWC